MRLGVLKEPEGERRVSIVPNSVKKLLNLGFEFASDFEDGLAATLDWSRDYFSKRDGLQLYV